MFVKLSVLLVYSGLLVFLLHGFSVHRYLLVLTPSFPTRLSSVLCALTHPQKAVSGSSRLCSGNAAAGIFIDAASGHVDDVLCHDGAFCAEHGLARPVPAQ